MEAVFLSVDNGGGQRKSLKGCNIQCLHLISQGIPIVWSAQEMQHESRQKSTFTIHTQSLTLPHTHNKSQSMTHRLASRAINS